MEAEARLLAGDQDVERAVVEELDGRLEEDATLEERDAQLAGEAHV